MGGNFFLPEQVEHYVSEVVTRESPVQKRLRELTATMPQHMMMTSPDQVAFLSMLVRLLPARRILEVGTFTGYSALAMAAALPEGGKLVACDMSQEWTDIARRFWHEGGVADRIELRLGKAKLTLESLIDEGLDGTFDLAFVDADKTGYDIYYEACLKLVRPGGVIAFDNMLWSGAVADPLVHDADTEALRALNLKIRNDRRVDTCLLTVADGMVLAHRRV